MSQSYANHRHLPVLFIVAFLSAVTSAVFAGIYEYSHVPHFARIYAPLLLAVICCCAIGRLYITRLQDRIVLLEVRYRTDKLLTPAQQASLWSLEKGQIVALRFASDAELPALLERASKDKLPPNEIKKAVKDWQADHART